MLGTINSICIDLSWYYLGCKSFNKKNGKEIHTNFEQNAGTSNEK